MASSATRPFDGVSGTLEVNAVVAGVSFSISELLKSSSAFALSYDVEMGDVESAEEGSDVEALSFLRFRFYYYYHTN